MPDPSYDPDATTGLPTVVDERDHAPDDAVTQVIPRTPAYAKDPDEAADVLDEGWEQQSRPTSRLTVLLVAGIVAALAFGGGVLVQKGHDASLLGGASRARTQFAGGTGAGGQGGGQGGGQTGGQGGGQGRSGGQGGGGDTAAAPASPAPAAAGGDATPVVVGTVGAVSGTTLTVTDFGGTAVTVTVPATATVSTSGLAGLAVGDPVSVVGTKGPDGAVTASAVTSRRAGG